MSLGTIIHAGLTRPTRLITALVLMGGGARIPIEGRAHGWTIASVHLAAFDPDLRYQLALSALDGKYNSIRTALRTQ